MSNTALSPMGIPSFESFYLPSPLSPLASPASEETRARTSRTVQHLQSYPAFDRIADTLSQRPILRRIGNSARAVVDTSWQYVPRVLRPAVQTVLEATDNVGLRALEKTESTLRRSKSLTWDDADDLGARRPYSRLLIRPGRRASAVAGSCLKSASESRLGLIARNVTRQIDESAAMVIGAIADNYQAMVDSALPPVPFSNAREVFDDRLEEPEDLGIAHGCEPIELMVLTRRPPLAQNDDDLGHHEGETARERPRVSNLQQDASRGTMAPRRKAQRKIQITVPKEIATSVSQLVFTPLNASEVGPQGRAPLYAHPNAHISAYLIPHIFGSFPDLARYSRATVQSERLFQISVAALSRIRARFVAPLIASATPDTRFWQRRLTISTRQNSVALGKEKVDTGEFALVSGGPIEATKAWASRQRMKFKLRKRWGGVFANGTERNASAFKIFDS
ncbi:MAG: hypothetical protein M1819_003144 [Sarea resinae]|nr:MAG: hypothetical protein M1819_003144 [Sarea resinae]